MKISGVEMKGRIIGLLCTIPFMILMLIMVHSPVTILNILLMYIAFIVMIGVLVGFLYGLCKLLGD